MTKKVIAGCLSVAILSGLAYYSSYLYSSKQFQENNVSLEQELAARRQQYISEENEPEFSEEIIIEEPLEEPLEPRQEASTEPSSVQTETVSYYLVEEFGYVNIYLSDKESIYEYTDISIDSLPEDLQLEICTGKGVASEQELYDFLENYSS